MRTVHCPLCGLRYAHVSELDLHAREDHSPEPPPEGQETVRVPGARPAARVDRRQVLRLPW